jgi:hypothetical protein
VAALTKTVDGKPLSEDQFAYVGDSKDISTWHLQIDKDHLDSALKMYGHETHVPADKKATVARRIASEAKKHGIDTKDFEQKYCGGAMDHADAAGWIEIFRAGDYRPQGKANITRVDLERVVRNYDPSYHEAPICVGHPKDNAPAYGWIDRVALDGDTLIAKEKQVDPAFSELRKAGRYKKRSASFYLDANGNVSGLRHVGYLGAEPPQVKGLQDVAFNDGRSFMSFGEEETVEDKSVQDQIKAFFANLFSGRSEGATFSEADVKRIVTEATQPLTEQVTKLQGDLAAQSTQFSEREKKIAGGEVKQRAVDAVNRLKGAGKWIPAYDKMGLGLIFDELAKQTITVEFGEAGQDGKRPQVSHLDLLAAFMEGLPKIVPEGRLVTPTRAGKAATVNFTEGRNVKADSNSIALNDAAEKLAKEKSISFGEALDQVIREHPELTVPGGAQAGQV